MRRFKFAVTLVIALFALLGLSACGGGSSETQSQRPSPKHIHTPNSCDQNICEIDTGFASEVESAVTVRNLVTLCKGQPIQSVTSIAEYNQSPGDTSRVIVVCTPKTATSLPTPP